MIGLKKGKHHESWKSNDSTPVPEDDVDIVLLDRQQMFR